MLECLLTFLKCVTIYFLFKESTPKLIYCMTDWLIDCLRNRRLSFFISFFDEEAFPHLNCPCRVFFCFWGSSSDTWIRVAISLRPNWLVSFFFRLSYRTIRILFNPRYLLCQQFNEHTVIGSMHWLWNLRSPWCVLTASYFTPLACLWVLSTRLSVFSSASTMRCSVLFCPFPSHVQLNRSYTFALTHFRSC